MKLRFIDLVFNYETNAHTDIKITASIDSNIGWQQWGQPKEELGENVELLEKINEVVQEYFSEEKEAK